MRLAQATLGHSARPSKCLRACTTHFQARTPPSSLLQCWQACPGTSGRCRIRVTWSAVAGFRVKRDAPAEQRCRRGVWDSLAGNEPLHLLRAAEWWTTEPTSLRRLTSTAGTATCSPPWPRHHADRPKPPDPGFPSPHDMHHARCPGPQIESAVSIAAAKRGGNSTPVKLSEARPAPAHNLSRSLSLTPLSCRAQFC